MPKKQAAKKKTSPPPPQKDKQALPANGFLSGRNSLIVVIVAFYLLIAVFFAPIVIKSMVCSIAPDMIAAAGMIEVAEKEMASGRFPLWNPTLYCGIPMYASLQYALLAYPPEFPIRLLSHIFGGSTYRVWLFHYLMAAFFVYLLARHYKVGKIAGWLAGAAYAFSPQLIVLIDVGHGSKLMGMVYLPLIWLMMDRLRLKPSPGRAAALGAVYAVEVLALHPQVAAYGGLMMGVYLVYYGIDAALKKDFGAWIKTAAYWVGSLLLSLALSAVLWVSVLDYARYSIRGSGAAGVAGGGVTWDYATGWSFSPLESITFLFPKFFGFAGGTYWGTVGTPDGTPFTQNPMYFGVIILLLAKTGMFLLKKKNWGFPFALAVFAWVLSFGKFLPILYGPLFFVLPFFNKFRAPVMGQVLLLLPAALMAGMGLQALLDRIRDSRDNETLAKYARNIAVGTGALAVLVLAGQGAVKSIYFGFAGMIRESTDPRVLEAAFQLAHPDIARVLVLIAVAALFATLALKRKTPWQMFAAIVFVLFLVDLYPINKKLVNFFPKRSLDRLFQKEHVIDFLEKDDGNYRVHPLDSGYPAVYWRQKLGVQTNVNTSNWLGYYGIEATTGYFGAKPANYQKLMTASNLDANYPYSWLVIYRNPELLDALNVRYILTTVPIETVYAELGRQTGGAKPARPMDRYRLEFMPRSKQPGSGAFIYRNLDELSRARLVDGYRIIEQVDPTIDEMVNGDWDPHREVLLDRQPGIEPQPGGVTDVQIIDSHPQLVDIKVSTSVPKLLVLADSFYPSGWSVSIDGEPAQILRANAVLRAVGIPPGEYRVIFRFHPKWFYAGLWVSIGTMLLLLLIWGAVAARSRSGSVNL